ncbi:MAG TPA: hypothetical protein VHO70_07705 [Chitinispirillaceae bacterium]|nr:hypothetical protein [Chitinispirillaceae bacterium]
MHVVSLCIFKSLPGMVQLNSHPVGDRITNLPANTIKKIVRSGKNLKTTGRIICFEMEWT